MKVVCTCGAINLNLARDNSEGKKSHGFISWGVIVITIISSPLEPCLLPGVLQEAYWPITFHRDDFACSWF